MRSRWAVAGAVALALTLSGCTGSASYSADTASTLQHGVLAVVQAAGRNDLAGAQQRLTALERLNDQAANSGEISRARHDAVAASIATVRADLTQLQDQATKARVQQLQQQQQEQQKQNGRGKSGKGDDEGGG